LADASFSGVNFLSSTYQTDDNGPVGVPVEAGDEELRFGLCKVSLFPFATHEAGGLVSVPRTLRLVEQRHMLDGGPGLIDQAFVAEVMDVLDEHLHVTHGLALFYLASLVLFAVDFVARQCLTQNGNEGTITR